MITKFTDEFISNELKEINIHRRYYALSDRIEKYTDNYWDALKYIRDLMKIEERYNDLVEGLEKIKDDKCPSDERHCGCVPVLRLEIERLSEKIKVTEDKLNCRYEKYISALELIASFSTAKDVAIDDLITIAEKVISDDSQAKLDACRYWVMKLEEETDLHNETKLKLSTLQDILREKTK